MYVDGAGAAARGMHRISRSDIQHGMAILERDKRPVSAVLETLRVPDRIFGNPVHRTGITICSCIANAGCH
jgi:hypothetical protein